MIRSIRGLAALLFVAGQAQAALDCALCHRPIADSFALTAHARASSVASAETIAGPFAAGRNELRTRVPGVYFRMEQRNGRYFQTAVQPGRMQSEPFDLVIGSGRRGQSYLYWRDGLLFQLPVSYHVASGRWINSPGYEDGTVHFGRGIPPQCLDCHASRFRLESAPRGPRYAEDFSVGIGCGKCHGEPERHDRIVRPSSMDLCARCHAGLKEEAHPEPDVHGNQVGLLKASQCFQKSGSLSCGTCHDVHRVERDPAALSGRCRICHTASSCPKATALGDSGLAGCVNCHMPLTPSKLIEVQSYRTHRIAVYRK